MQGAIEASSRPLLRVVSNAAMDAAAQQEAQSRASATMQPEIANALASYIRTQFETFKRHRDRGDAGWSERLLTAQRVFNGQYDAQKLADIRQFGGAEVYARLVAMKCRGASSLLRDVYLSSDRPWGLDPPSDPAVPQFVQDSIKQLVQSEAGAMQQQGAPVDVNAIKDRAQTLTEAARQAAKKKAADQARIAEDKIDEILTEGGFYKAFEEFLSDLPKFPFACVKGPVVRIVPTVTWVNGQAVTQQKPKLFWNRVSPFDIWWTPGAAGIEEAMVVERTRVTRAELNDLLDLPGYDQNALRSVLEDYGRGGLVDAWDQTDAERATLENRENPQYNQSGLITCLEIHGNIQGQTLLDGGMSPADIPDPLRDYFVQAWLIGNYVIKVQMSPSPRKRHPYFITSFEKMPGTPVGNGLTDILADIQESANATLRALVNNLAISSGPQVVVHTDRVAAGEDGNELYPWKRWQMVSDPMGQGSNSVPPVSFFQPQSNAQELVQVYDWFSKMADDISAIPRYLSGDSSGGAGRTASGLAMLMGNASKILQTVAGNIDGDILDPALSMLFDMIMLTDTSGLLTGEESIRVMGVNVAVQRETQRQRQLEFLQATANPLDAQIIGPKGRAQVLRSIADQIGLPGETIVPSEDQLNQQQQQAQQAAQQQGQPGHAMTPPEAPGQQGNPGAAQAQGAQPTPMNQDMGPRTRVVGGPH